MAGVKIKKLIILSIFVFLLVNSTASVKPAGDHNNPLENVICISDRATGKKLKDCGISLGNEEIEKEKQSIKEKAANGLIIWQNNEKSELPENKFDVKNEDALYYIMQLYSPLYGLASDLGTTTREEILSNIQIVDISDSNNFYVKIKKDKIAKAKNLVSNKRVRYIGEIPSKTKIDKELSNKIDGNKKYKIIVKIFEINDIQVNKIKALLENSFYNNKAIYGTAKGAAIREISSFNFVEYIEESLPGKLFNLEGTMAVASDVDNSLGYKGTNVKVTIADSGMEFNGSFSKPHPDFSNRIYDAWGCLFGDCQGWDLMYAGNDEGQGHGTHIAGTIGSSGQASNGRYRGVAPETELLIHQIVMASDWTNALEQSSRRSSLKNSHIYGTSISTSQAGLYGRYNTGSETLDRLARGEFGSDTNVIIAIGNTQCKHTNTVTAYWATAKNAISVGAVKDGYPFDHRTYSCDSDYSDACDSPSVMCEQDNWPPAEISCFSSCGPIDTDNDGQSRTKPDVVAPGLITTSTSTMFTYDNCWNDYSGEGPGTDSCDYTDMSGTSMAQPFVTGAIALFLQAHPEFESWPETIKAHIINTAIPINTGEWYRYGYGLVDAYHMIYSDSSFKTLKLIGDSVSQSKDYPFTVPSGVKELKAILTWFDPAGRGEAINRLAFSFVKPDGSVVSISYKPDDNVMDGSLSNPVAGEWKLRVRFVSGADSSSFFGASVAAVMNEPSLSLDAFSDRQDVIGSEEFTITSQLSNSGYTAAGSYMSLALPPGFSLQNVVSQRDGGSFIYNTTWIKKDPYSVPTGELVVNHPRTVAWVIKPSASLADGSYTFTATGDAINSNGATDFITINYVKTGCSCGSWSAGSCGGSDCSQDERLYTRTCTPSGCSSNKKCVYESSCRPTTRTICKSGCNYNTILSALNAANPGDTLLITDRASYTENPPLDWSKVGVTLDCNGATLDGQNQWDYGIKLRNSANDNIIRNCNIKRFGIGIYSYVSYGEIGLSHNRIYNNNIMENTYGVNFRGDVHTTWFRYNNFSRNSIGIFFEGVSSVDSPQASEITDNNFFNNTEYGIKFECVSVGNNLIDRNIFRNNANGLYISSSDYNSFTTVQNNNITNNGIGITLSNTQLNTISWNTFCPSNVQNDFSISSSGITGSNNMCDKPDGWNDGGSTGCSSVCCTDECVLNQTRCNSEYEQTCGNYDLDRCVEWPSSTSGEGNEYCVSGCSIGACICISHYSRQCYDGDIYWYDSCGDRQEKKEDCAIYPCSSGKCLASYNVNLKKGWNLFSVPANYTETGNLLNSIKSGIGAIFIFNSSSGRWKGYNKNIDFSSIYIPEEYGMWLNYSSNYLWQVTTGTQDGMFYNLKKGVNLIGYNGLKEEAIEHIFGYVMPDVKAIYYYENGIWKTYAPGKIYPNALVSVKPGMGLWVYVYDNVGWYFRTEQYNFFVKVY